MIELFFLLLKGQFYEIMCSLLTCCGNPLCGPAVYSKIRQIRKIGFTARPPLFEKS
jgi:hypothetical protein